MAKARKILKRAKAVGSIRTVTKTMEMVATARFRKSHNRVVATKPFVERLAEAVKELTASGTEIDTPLLRPGVAGKPDVLLVITSNRGLAGPFNSSVLKMAMERLRQLRENGREVQLHVVGKRGIQFMRFRRQSMAKTYTQFDRIATYEQVSDIANEMMALFARGEIASLEVAYMQFVSSGRQMPAVARVLPLTELTTAVEPWTAQQGVRRNYDLLPSVGQIVDKLLPLSMRMKLYQCFLDAAVSEQMMRITAMRSATDSADQMLHDLTVMYNRTRQAQITTELAEIMGGADGLKEG